MPAGLLLGAEGALTKCDVRHERRNKSEFYQGDHCRPSDAFCAHCCTPGRRAGVAKVQRAMLIMLARSTRSDKRVCYTTARLREAGLGYIPH